MNYLQEKIEKLAFFFIIYTLCFYLFFATLKYTMPFVLALLFALILKYPTRLMIERLKLKGWIASITSTLIFFGILIFIIVMIFTSLINEIIGLTGYLQKIISNNSSNIYDYFTLIQGYLYNLNIDPIVTDSIKNNLSTSATNIVNTSISAGTAIVQGTITILGYIPYIVMVIIFTLITTYFFTNRISSTNPSNIFNYITKGNDKIIVITNHAKKMLANYFLSYLFVIFITFLITLIGFNIFGVKYALVLSILCALLDLLPVVGMPLIYLPLSITNIISKNYVVGIGLLILYAIVFVVRQIVEPKIMSSSLGLNPVAVLAAIFIGLQANGISGMIFCMFLVVFYEILKKVDVV
ncbi:sporulation integral membrane protein YtvI [Clostridium polyendosporum]|uniref:Sporulation integral membrane protein YtvI n=1 Tax=Clostridium polyendosporum TaxID=69208 RepID=A0A919S036_9CLOT|nr:sporulation integral membrane protein YtvI [Clostridium polyendosporum]GIM28969.1 sporulation integral membrane protein YtvI [Clostridium polyendosporum]